jgi:hypothetical protein
MVLFNGLIANGKFQIPPDLVVKSQAIDIAKIIFIMNQATKRRSNAV